MPVNCGPRMGEFTQYAGWRGCAGTIAIPALWGRDAPCLTQVKTRELTVGQGQRSEVREQQREVVEVYVFVVVHVAFAGPAVATEMSQEAGKVREVHITVVVD